MASVRLENEKQAQQNQRRKNAAHEKHDKRQEQHKLLKDEVIEQNIIKMQNQKLINAVNKLLNKRLKQLGVSKEELQEYEEAEQKREEKLRAEQQAMEGAAEKTQEELELENIRIMEDQTIDSSPINPPIAEFAGMLVSNDDVCSKAIEQFARAQYDVNSVDLTTIPKVMGMGRVGIAVELIRCQIFAFMVESMKKKFAPDELYEMWLELIGTGILRPEVCKIADQAIQYMIEKLSPEEVALTTPVRLAAMIVEAIKEAYKLSSGKVEEREKEKEKKDSSDGLVAW